MYTVKLQHAMKLAISKPFITKILVMANFLNTRYRRNRSSSGNLASASGGTKRDDMRIPTCKDSSNSSMETSCIKVNLNQETCPCGSPFWPSKQLVQSKTE